jgi:hypothetical protein
MKKIFLAIMLLSVVGTTAIYAGGGKKKTKSKAKTGCCEKACKKDKKCEPGTCILKPVCTNKC